VDWVKRLHGQVVGLDTAPLIYFVESHPAYIALVDPFFEAIGEGKLRVVTSMLTLTEVLTLPFKRSDLLLAQRYADTLLRAPGFEAVPVTDAIATDAAELRAPAWLQDA
jgi:hypothetical protein